MSPQLAAHVFAGLSGLVIFFQLALAAGAPWGGYAMGGAYPGVFPPRMRVAAAVNAVVVALVALVILSRSGLVLPAWQPASRWLAWAVVGLLAVGVMLNLITPSKGERRLWAPVAILLFLSAVVVALG